MNNNFANPIASEQDNAPRIENEYTKYDTAAALILFPVAFAFVHLSGAADYPLGRFLLLALLFALSLVYMKKSGIKLTENRFALGLGITMLLLNLGLIFTSNEAVQFAISAITFFSYPYFIFTISGNSSEKHPSGLFPLEMVKAVLIMPFGSMTASFEAASSTKNGKKIGKTLLMILAGLAIAFIPTIIVFALLSYDQSFKALTDKLLDLGDFDIFSFISDLIFAVPLAILIFGALYSGKNRRFSEFMTAEKCKSTANAVRFAPLALVCSAVSPFIIIYSVFFVSQLGYYLSAFSGILPEGLTYADYAKSGFFELCTVSAINAVIILCVSLFCRRKEEKPPILLRIVNILLSVLTLILIATAISKMVLYIDTYGLTVKRVLSSSFMIFLAVVFIAILIKQFARKTNVILTALITGLLICAALAFADVNGIIADYNTDRYLSRTLYNFDCGLLYDLGDSGIIHLDRIAEDAKDKNVREKAINLLTAEADARKDDENSIFSFTIPRLRSSAILEKYKNEE
ncbi:MAG: DUF4173 domain-containing protein [Clostridia bacterium]|nr:DUF4173 domain-containing protein [Clostridia bacterium]